MKSVGRFFDWKFWTSIAVFGMVLVIVFAQINARQSLVIQQNTSKRATARITQLQQKLEDANNKIIELERENK